MKSGHLILLLVLNVFWVGALSSYKALDAYPYLTYGGIVTLRFGLAALCLLALWPWLPGPAPRGADLFRTILMGLIVFLIGHRLQVLGVKLGTAGNSSVLMGMEPLLTSVAAALFLGELITAQRWAGFALGLLGVVLLNRIWAPGFQFTSLAASAIFLSSFLCEAAYSIMGKRLIERADITKVCALALLAGTLGNLCVDGGATLAAARQLPAQAWWIMAYMAVICTALGYVVWYRVIRVTDVNIVALTIFVQPVAGVFLAAVWIGEPLHWGQLWGCLIIVLGLVIGLRPAVKSRVAAVPRSE